MKNFRKFRLIALLAISIFLSSCGHLVKLDFAQRNFNEAATLENNARFSQTSSSVSPESYYRLSYAHVNKAMQGRGKNSLDEDGVLGNAYTIKALCEWKLGEYDNARNTAKTALTYLVDDEDPNPVLNRDAAVMKALDALIDIEKANEMVITTLANDPPPNASDTEKFYKEWIYSGDGNSPGKVEAAINMIDVILKSVPPKHEVRTYFGMSKLSALKVWSDALHFINNNSKKAVFTSDEKKALRTLRANLKGKFEDTRTTELEDFANTVPDNINNEVYKYWSFLLGAGS